jgi:hypothetical protein
MQLPKKSTMTRKLIDAMPKDRGVPRSHIGALMISLGYQREKLDVTLGRLVTIGYFETFGATYRLTAAVLKNFQAKEESPAYVDTFKPLNQRYIDSMRRACRFEDGRKPMTFIACCGTRPNPL